MAQVEFRQVSKRFTNGVMALDHLSLEIAAGELIVLVGPSGCGKSTALRLLAGLEPVTEGEIRIGGQRVNEATPQQRNVAMVFQNYALYPHLSVQQNLAFPLRMAHLDDALVRDKVAEIAELLDLTALLQRKPVQLSGGQRQRVAMGRALVRDPSVFLLDEPLSNLDAKLRAQIRGEIGAIQKRLRKTTLYVTHDQVEAMTLGDRVAVMYAGQLQQLGSPEMLYLQPENIFVARFIGSPGMNIITAALRQEADGMILRVAGQSISMSAETGLCDAWQQCSQQTAFLGIRPEAISLDKNERVVALRARIRSVEYLGHESLVHFYPGDNSASDTIWVARITGRVDCSKDETRDVYVKPEAMYLFDKNEQFIYTVHAE